MSKGESNKISICLLKDDYMEPNKYLKDGYEKKEVIEGAGILYYINSKDKSPKWVKGFFKQDIEGLKQANSRAILIIELENPKKKFAVTFGQGRYMLNDSAIVENFGIKVLLNSIEKDDLKSLTSQSLDGNHGISTINLPLASEIGEFRIDKEKDFIRKIKAKSKDELFKNKVIVGSEVLTFSGKYDVSNIKELVEKILHKYQMNQYKQDFGFIDFVKPIKKKDEKEKINKLLDEKIKSNEVDLMLIYPYLSESENISGFRYCSSNSELFLDLDFDDYRKYVIESGKVISVEKMKKDKVLLYDINEEFLEKKPVYQYLVAEFKSENSNYCLVNGSWYEIKNTFYDEVERYYDSVEVEENIPFIDFSYKDENEYNAALAKSLTNSVEMHRGLIKTQRMTNSVEAADIYFENAFIHIKQKTGSAQLSHLFSQGFVSAQLLLQEDFRNELLKEFGNNANLKSNLEDFKPGNNKVVFASITDRTDRKPKLPFFSKVTFKQYHQTLVSLGYKVSVYNIARK